MPISPDMSGVYVVEQPAFPGSVVEVATAIPAFVGYTQIAVDNERPLANTPFRIASMAEFETHFGGAPPTVFTLSQADAAAPRPADFSLGLIGYRLDLAGPRYLLHACMEQFFENGGGPCYIVSVGLYPATPSHADLIAGIAKLEAEQEPTLLVVPEAVLLDKDSCIQLQRDMLSHCGALMRNRFAILDIHDGFKSLDDTDAPIEVFRGAVGDDNVNYGAAYYPWLNTNVIEDHDLGFGDFLDPQGLLPPGPTPKVMIEAALRKLNLLPPSATMAGVFTAVDNSRGVWTAPANVGVNGVLSPTIMVSDEQQAGLNVDPQGKSINVIRSFPGRGLLVWGARTLDGNSPDWRYINARRTAIFLEESIRLALKGYVFEPNVAETWVTIRTMIENFLTSIWRRGALAGAMPKDAFSVNVGLGDTMTADDIVDGYIRVALLVALTHPAEFIEISFQQAMQMS